MLSPQPVPTLLVQDLEFAYGKQVVLRLPHLRIGAATRCAVLGPSGCGKTTLLHVIAGLLRPTRGSVHISGHDLATLSPSECDRFRGSRLGIVFQKLHLLPALDVLENLLLAQRFARVPVNVTGVSALLDQLGILSLRHAMPSMLSQGQAQRVAIARALVHQPQLILADEPTSGLDDHNAARALDLLQTHARGAALLVVTHDQRVRGRLGQELSLEPVS